MIRILFLFNRITKPETEFYATKFSEVNIYLAKTVLPIFVLFFGMEVGISIMYSAQQTNPSKQ